MKRTVSKTIFISLVIFLFTCSAAFALDKTLTVPAEAPQGVSLSLSAGAYIAEIAGGAVSLFFPIHPQYQWLYGLAIGTGTEGGQDVANIGALYFEPYPKVFTQAEAEKQALAARQEKETGTFLEFTLKEEKQVRFWVSDFDYSDNTGSLRVRIYSLR